MTHVLRESHADMRTLLEPPEVVEVAYWHHTFVLVATLELVTRPAPAVQLRFAAGDVLSIPDPKGWPDGFRSFAQLAADRAAFMGPGAVPAEEPHLDRVRRMRNEYLRELDRTFAYLRPHFVGWALREVHRHVALRGDVGEDFEGQRVAG